MDEDGLSLIRVHPCSSVVGAYWLRLCRAALYRGLPTRHSPLSETTPFAIRGRRGLAVGDTADTVVRATTAAATRYRRRTPDIPGRDGRDTRRSLVERGHDGSAREGLNQYRTEEGQGEGRLFEKRASCPSLVVTKNH